MRPVRLEMHGFASFRDETIVDFVGADYFARNPPTTLPIVADVNLDMPILTYDFVVDMAGHWQRVGTSVVSDWLYPLPRASSLVLVFGPEDRLVRHSLVTGPRNAAPPVTPPAPVPPN